MKLAWIAALYISAVLFFVWGVAAGHYQIFPYNQLAAVKNNISEFIEGDQDDETSIAQRLLNDFNISPERNLREYTPVDSTGFREISLENFSSRREAIRVSVAPDAPALYRIVVGAFDFEEAFWGAVLFDPEGNVVHRWYLNGQGEGFSDIPDTLKNLYGVGFFPDGSVTFTMQETQGGIGKVGYCSERQWDKTGDFHHVAQPTEDFSALWSFGGGQGDLHPVLVLMDAQTGETLKEVDMADVEKANPDDFIFDLRRREGPEHDHATHPNDIDPLPAAVAEAYPQFSAGDLALSYHTTNMILVVDPETLEIKWWYVGSGDGQHDPDWHADGTITIFNNNYRASRRGQELHSTIVSIDPLTKTHRTIVDGRSYDFFSRVNGHHVYTGEGTVIITSSTQGRVFEVDLETGEVVFEFINAYDWDDGRTLHMSEAFVVDEATAKRWLETDC